MGRHPKAVVFGLVLLAVASQVSWKSAEPRVAAGAESGPVKAATATSSEERGRRAPQPKQPRAAHQADAGASAIDDIERRVQALDPQDMDAAVRLGVELLSEGETGFDGIVQLMQRRQKAGPSEVDTLRGKSGLLAGHWFRTISEHADEMLEFGLYLHAHAPDELPDSLQELRQKMSRRLGVMILAYAQPHDPVLLDRYADMFDEQLSSGGDARPALDGLAQLPTARATALLIRSYDDGVGSRTRILKRLFLRGDATALDALAQRTEDPELLAIIDTALQHVKPGEGPLPSPASP